jgi:hypothetical protein
MKIAKPTVVADDVLLINVDIMKAKLSCRILPTLHHIQVSMNFSTRLQIKLASV